MLPHSKSFAAIVAACALLTAAATAFGQVGYTTTFDDITQYPINGGSLSGQGGATPGGPGSWDTTDPDKTPTTPGYTGESVGQSDFVGTLSGYSNPPTDYWAFLGGLQHGTTATGILPGSSTIYDFRDFSVSGATTNVAFNADFAVSSSTVTYPNRDNFGWTFRSGTGTTGTNLFSLNFVPATNPVTGLPALRIGYTVGGTSPSTANSAFYLPYDSRFHLTMSVNVVTDKLDISLVQISNGTLTTVATGIALAGIDPTTITEVAPTWILGAAAIMAGTDANGGYVGAGNNALIFNNYFVTIPEPSTYAMLCLGFVAALVYARRRVAD